MKKALLLILTLSFFFSIVSSSHALPEFSEDSMTKIVMPGGIYFAMQKDDAIALLKKRHPIQTYEGGAYYQVTENSIQESYDIKFVCGMVWAISFVLQGPDDDVFYERLAPLKDLMEKLRPYYSGPIYGKYKVKVALLGKENIKFEMFDSSIDGKASIDIYHFLGDLYVEPVIDCSDSQ